jgi:Putative zinc binding domain
LPRSPTLPECRAIDRCRIGGSGTLVTVLDLDGRALTGVFPKFTDAAVTTGPLRLVWCPNSDLLQLSHSCDLGEWYGDRSGLNRRMGDHLTQKVHELERVVAPSAGDTALDIGSNDATSLKAYKTPLLKRMASTRRVRSSGSSTLAISL